MFKKDPERELEEYYDKINDDAAKRRDAEDRVQLPIKYAKEKKERQEKARQSLEFFKARDESLRVKKSFFRRLFGG